MHYLNRILAFVPLSIHIAYAAATLGHLPPELGRTTSSPGTRTWICIVVWFSLIALLNGTFIFLHVRMSKFKDSFLTLSRKKSGEPLSAEGRSDRVRRFQSVAETSLLSLNLFFLAAYQAVYQANVLLPVVRFPMPVLFVGFMVAPLLLTAVHIAFVGLSLSEKPTNGSES